MEDGCGRGLPLPAFVPSGSGGLGAPAGTARGRGDEAVCRQFPPGRVSSVGRAAGPWLEQETSGRGGGTRRGKRGRWGTVDVVGMCLSDDQRAAFIARKKPKSSFLQIREILDLLNRGYRKSAYICYMKLRVAKRKVITRPQYIHLTNMFGRKHGMHAARIIFDDMHRRHKPCTYAFNVMMKLYADQGHPRKCRHMFELMGDKYVDPDAYSYAILMDAHNRFGEFEEVTNIYDEMVEEGIDPNSFTLDSLMRAYHNARDYEGVITISRTRDAYPNALPTTHSHAMLISAHAALGDIDSAVAAYEHMLRDFDLHAAWREEEERKKEMQRATRPVDDLAALSPEEEAFEEEQKKQLYEDAVGFREREDDEDDANDEEDERGGRDRRAAAEAEDDDDDDEDPDAVAEAENIARQARPRLARPWASLIRLSEDGFMVMMQTRAGDPEGIRSVLRDALKSPVVVSPQLFGTCLTLLVQAGDRDGAREVLQLLEDSSGTPAVESPDVLNTKLRAYGELGCVKEVVSVHDRLRAGSLRIDKYTLNLLVDAYRKLDMAETAIETVEELRSLGFKANLGTYNILMEIHAAGGNSRAAEKLLAKMKRRKLRSNTRTLNLVMRAYLSNREPEKVLPLVEHFEDDATPPNVESFELLLRAAVDTQAHAHLEKLVEQLHISSLDWSADIFVLMAEYHVRVAPGDAEDNHRQKALDTLTRRFVSNLLDSSEPELSLHHVITVMELLLDNGHSSLAARLAQSLAELRSRRPHLATWHEVIAQKFPATAQLATLTD